jgi:O-antigen ligase
VIRSPIQRQVIRKPELVLSSSAWPQWLPRLLWGLLLALAIRFTVFIRQREGGSFGEVDTNAGAEVIIVLGTLFLLLFAPAFRMAFSHVRRSSLLWLTGLYLLGMVSALWSPMPAYSAFRAVEQISQLLAVVAVLAMERDALQAERKVLLVFIACLVLDWSTVVKFYGLSLALGAWHTNTYSASAGMVTCYCAAELMSGRKYARNRLWLFGAVALFAVILGTSAASNIAVAIGLAFAALSTRNWKVLSGCLLVLVMVGLASMMDRNMFSILLAGKDPEAVKTLTGRTHLWELYLPRFLDSPLLGEGYAVSSRLSDLYTTNTHSSPVSVLMGLGVVGGAVFVVWLIALLGENARAVIKRRPFALGCASGLLAGLINSLSCAYLGEGYSIVTLMFNSMLTFFVIFVAHRRGVGPQAAVQWRVPVRGRPALTL